MSYIFVFMILASIVCSFFTDTSQELSASIMDGASNAVELLIMMSGMLCLWSGIMEVAKECELTQKLAKLFSPLLRRLFPDVKKDSRAFECICMNVSANLLGLANAATPLGLTAMQELNKDNKSDVATNSMITFVVMNTASIQLLPTTIATMRKALGSQSPFDIIICVWITSAVALFTALAINRIIQSFGGKKWTT